MVITITVDIEDLDACLSCDQGQLGEQRAISSFAVVWNAFERNPAGGFVAGRRFAGVGGHRLQIGRSVDG